MIKIPVDMAELLHQLIAQETGGEIVDVGLGLASGSMKYEQLVDWIRDHLN